MTKSRKYDIIFSTNIEYYHGSLFLIYVKNALKGDIVMEDEKSVFSERDINLTDFLRAIWSKKILIIALIILGVLLMFVKTQFLTKETYTTTGKLLVSNRTEEVNDNFYVNQGDILTARYMSETYTEILKTRDFLEKVATELAGVYSWKDIDSMVNCSIVNETELLQITVTANNAAAAEAIGRVYLENAKSHLMDVHKGCEVEIVDRARVPEQANDKGMLVNIVVGVFIGLAIGLLIAFIIVYFDTKVRKSEDVARRYQISILGELSDC